MKGFLTCLAALGWIGLVIYQTSPRRPRYRLAGVWPQADPDSPVLQRVSNGAH